MTSIKTIFILVQFSPILRKRKKKHAKRKITQNSNKNRKNIIGIPVLKRKDKKKVTALVTLFTKMIEGGSGG